MSEPASRVRVSDQPTYVAFPCYKMSSYPRGLCLIINNEDFSKSAVPLKKRRGTSKDKDALTKTFKKLGFTVKSYDNQTDQQMVQLLKRVSDLEEHANYDCFVCCILSHGCMGKVYGTNGISVDIMDITSIFKPQFCPRLTGKPKLFFIQACQGRKFQKGYRSLEPDSTPEEAWIPNEADFLLGFSTVPGHESYRDPDEGCVFIQKLTQCLDRYGDTNEIHEILTKVNQKVGEEMNNVLTEHGVVYDCKQSPAPMYTLRKKLRFFKPDCELGVQVRPPIQPGLQHPPVESDQYPEPEYVNIVNRSQSEEPAYENIATTTPRSAHASRDPQPARGGTRRSDRQTPWETI